MSCLLTRPVIWYEEAIAGVHAPRRIIEALVQGAGAPLCPSCIAFSTDLALADVRRILQGFEAIAAFKSEDAPCATCARWQRVVRLVLDGPADAERFAEIADVRAREGIDKRVP